MRTEGRAEMHGILLVDKPCGPTSAAVVARVKRALGQRKVGHLGTLDPFATGLLPICLGNATKLAQFLADDEKRYVGEIVLGVETDTLDSTGRVVAAVEVPVLSPEQIARAVASLRGEILQTPPMYSALKRGGVPLYRLARAGQDVAREARQVRVAEFDVALVARDRLAFAVTCSRGTYVRVLAQDLGVALGTGAHLAALRRTACGAFRVRNAISPEAVVPDAISVVAPSAALAQYRAVVANPAMIAAIRRGQQQALRGLGLPRRVAEIVRVESEQGDLVAVAEAGASGGESSWRLARVLGA